MARYDAVLIPGGGVRENGELPIWTERRLDYAVQRQSYDYFVTLSAGTTHKPPPRDEGRYPIFESVAAANYLVAAGISATRILVETSSYDTIGNAFFSRLIHVDPLGMRKLLIVTSEFHMPRTKAIFEWIYGLDASSKGYALEFASVSDEGIDQALLASRKQKEQRSLEKLLEVSLKITSLRELHHWLFSSHGAYAISKSAVRETGQVLETY